MKVIFVGDRPSPKMKPGAKPFEGAACERRLMEWIKVLDVKDYLIINSCDYNMPRYRLNRELMLNVNNFGDKYVALGNNASKALKDIPHFRLPHPSGLNRKLNNKEFIESELKKCYDYLKERNV